MKIEIELPDELETRIRHQAELAGVDVDRFVHNLIQAGVQYAETMDTLADPGPPPEDWIERFHEWVENFPRAKHTHMDDSRESIYEDRA